MSNEDIRGPSRAWLRQRVAYPLAFIAAAAGITAVLLGSESELDTTIGENTAIAVRSLEISLETVVLSVRSEGTVQPSIKTNLVAQVSGEVVYVNDALRAGGRFSAGDSLLRIDPQDYEHANLQATAKLQRAAAEADYFSAENKRLIALSKQDMVSESQLRDAHRAADVAQAGLLDAQVQLSNTQLNLSRTNITAPYDGRVASEQVDIGQFMARGGVIAQLYATEQLEVRLPLADSQLGFLDPLILETGIYTYNAAPRVSLSASYAGKKHGWNGKLLRSEGAIDRQSRVVYVVAQVDDPKSQHGIDLPVGLFLEAEISGITVENAAVIPRSAVREGNRVLVISSDNTLHFRQIEVLRYENEHAVVTSGLTAGERICLSPLQYVVDGMSVTLAN